MRQFHLLLLLLALAFTLSANGGVIPGFRVGINHTGFDTRGAVYVPFDSTGTEGHLKQDQVDLLATIQPKTGRDMDWLQVVTNDTASWATRSNNDFSDKGITYETDINAANQIRGKVPDYEPWINSPLLADEDHDRQLGRLWGQRYGGKVIRFGKGNEVWNIFGNNLPAQNLFAARADPSYEGGDAEKAQRRQGHRLAVSTKAFIQGLHDVNRFDVKVIMEVEGFSPVADFARYQLDEMKQRGFDPKELNAHVAIAQYAAGSPTDIAIGGTDQQKHDNVLAFVNGSLVEWTKAHHDLALAEGLDPVVDAYEMRIGMNFDSSWIPFQYRVEQFDLQAKSMMALYANAGSGSIFNVEGLYGFPWNNSNQFSLIDLNKDLNSQAYQGVLSTIDFSTTPEPGGLLLVVFAALIIIHRWPQRSNS